MSVVHIGNPAAQEGFEVKDPDGKSYHIEYRPVEGDRITEIHLPETLSLTEKFRTITTIMPKHLQQNANPMWVECNDKTLQTLLVEEYNLGKNVRPDYYGKENKVEEGLIMPLSSLQALLSLTLLVPTVFGLWAASKMALRTNSGRDFQSGVMFSTASNGGGAFASATYIGVSADTTAPAAGDVTLTGEISTGTLVRAQATYAHTTGTSSATLTRLFTSDQTITVAKIGVFNNPTFGAGTMVLESLLATVATMVSGDQLSITETITL